MIANSAYETKMEVLSEWQQDSRVRLTISWRKLEGEEQSLKRSWQRREMCSRSPEDAFVSTVNSVSLSSNSFRHNLIKELLGKEECDDNNNNSTQDQIIGKWLGQKEGTLTILLMASIDRCGWSLQSKEVK